MKTVDLCNKLEIINDDRVRTIAELNNECVGYKVLVLLERDSDISSLSGTVYAVSKGIESFDELCSLSSDLNDVGQQNIIVGTYSKGGCISVQC